MVILFALFAENQVAADYINALVNQERILTLTEKEKKLSQKVNYT